MSPIVRIALVLLLCLNLCLGLFDVTFSPASASASCSPPNSDPNAEAITGNITSFATGVLNDLGYFGALGDKVPMTEWSPSSDEALDLGNLFGNIFSGLDTCYEHFSDIGAAISGLSGNYTGIDVDFASVVAAEDADFGNVSFTMTATRENFRPPVDFSYLYGNSTINLAGGEVPLNLTLSTDELHFQLDKHQTNPALAVYLIGEPKIHLSVGPDDTTISSFPSRVGFTDINVYGNATMYLGIDAAFHDPDNDGHITTDEWTNTSSVDLVTVSYLGNSSVNAVLNIDTPLISTTSPDGNITLTGNVTGNVFTQSATANLGAFSDFNNVVPTQVLNGLSAMAASLMGVQSIADLEIPFLRESMGNIFVFAQPLIDFIKKQGEAAIICGTQDTNPPTGSTANLKAGECIYCQAIALQNPGNDTWTGYVDWQIPPEDGTVLGNGTNTATVGIHPTANAKISLTTGDSRQIGVTFSDPSQGNHTVNRLFETAQDLGEKLANLSGFDPGSVTPQYDPATHALTYGLKKTWTPEPGNGTVDFGGQLEDATGLVDLSPVNDTEPNIEIQPGNASLDVTFGIILIGNETDIVGGQGKASDRFYLKIGNATGEHELKLDDASVEAGTTLDFQGTLGYLEVEAQGDKAANKVNDQKEFEIGRYDLNQPMLALDINGPGVAVHSDTENFTIPNAILVNSLLRDPTGNMTARPNVKMSAGLSVSSFVGNHTELGGGNVSISWPKVFDDSLPFGQLNSGNLTVVPDDDFIHNLKALDIEPGNSTALLRVILANLGNLTQQLDDLKGTGPLQDLDTKLPIVATSPRDLMSQFGTLQEIIDEITVTPPVSLQELEALLEYLLSVTPSGPGNASAPGDIVNFELKSVQSTAPNKDLIIHLNYGSCTENNTVIDGNQTTDAVVYKPEPKIYIDLGLATPPLPALVGLEGDPSFQLEYASRVQLDLGIPLATDPNAAFVIDTSVASVDVGLGASEGNLTANVGPLKLDLGTGIMIVSGTHQTGNNTPILVDPSGNFTSIDTMVPVGAMVKNTIQNTTGFVTSVNPGNLTCTNTWNEGDTYEVWGAGIANMSAKFGLGVDTTGSIYSIDDFVSNLEAAITGNASQQCSNIIGTGEACAFMSMGLNGTYLGNISFLAGNLTDPSTWSVSYSNKLGNEVDNATIDFTLLTEAPKMSGEQIGVMLSGGSDLSLPLIGNALDAGADVKGTLQQAYDSIAEQLQNMPGLTGITASEIKGNITEAVWNALEDSDLLLKKEDPHLAGGKISDIIVTTKCGTGNCTGTEDKSAINDVEIKFWLGQRKLWTTPFDIGVRGLPLSAKGNVTSEGNWTLGVDFGVSRDLGPYIRVGNESETDPELKLAFGVGLGNCSACCDKDPKLNDDPDGLRGNYSAERCLAGTLGFLQVTLSDGNNTSGNNTKPSKLALDLNLNLTTPSGLLPLGQLASSSVKLKPEVVADANINLRIRVGITGTDAYLPSLLSTFHLKWHGNTTAGKPGLPEIVFQDIYIDSGSFIASFLCPVVKEVQRVTSPLKPVIDTLQAPLPVVSDLSNLVGGEDITLLGLAQAVSGNQLDMVTSIIAIIHFINGLECTGETLWIGLGQVIPGGGELRYGGNFTVNAALAQAGPLGPNDAGKLVNDANVGGDLLNDLKDGANPTDGDRPSTFGVPGLEFPIFSNPLQVLYLLMGQDATLVRYDTGILRASAGISYDFGPIMIGPIPITIGIFGSVAVEGRLAIGYDTSGLRGVFGGEPATALLDGLYLDDLDSNGVDVPEIRLIGTVGASCGVDLVIVSAGVEGGLELTVNLNLADGPVFDGKLRIDEIRAKLDNPICLFDVSGSLDAFLRAYVKIDFFFFSKKWSFTLVRVTLLDFSHSCQGTNPVLASQVGNTLTLNMGPRRGDRGIQTEEINEVFTVRQIGDGNVSVTAWGVYQEYPRPGDPPIPITLVTADAGDGDDVISLEPGVDSGNVTHAFTIRAEIHGGTENDVIRGGDGGDSHYWGGEGDDEISGGNGADFIYGEAGIDNLGGGLGTDRIEGGYGNDLITGGPGADYLYGFTQAWSSDPNSDPYDPNLGSDDDQIYGGPGTDAHPDEGDSIYGGPGNDDIEGNEGDDNIYGDESISNDADGWTSGGNDQTKGGKGNDHIWGGAGNDVVIGESGNETIYGNGGNDYLDGDDDDLNTPDGSDVIYGGSGDDDLFGRAENDTIYGQGGNDDISGGLGVDALYGGTNRDYMFGDDGYATRDPGQEDAGSISYSESVGDGDFIHGDDGNDVMYGEGGIDEMYGEVGDDYMEGNGGDDNPMHGGTGIDEMYGRAGNDVMHGDSENDVMYGDSGNDKMYGDANDDTMRGGIGDDYMEGNGGTDTMHGDSGQDDMMGGTSSPGSLDQNDFMYGDSEQDVMLGDNGNITRPGGNDTADGSVIRTLVLYNIDCSNPDSFGNDTMWGSGANDDMYGGGGSDTMYGDAGDDYMEGNCGGDWIYGGADQDDVMGGTSQGGGVYPDGSDHIYGGDGAGGVKGNDYDILMGDNALITRPTLGGSWQVNKFNAAIVRNITLYNVASVSSPAPAGTSDGDFIWGEASDDVIYGQGGDDEIHGGKGEDYIEGNSGADTMYGDDGNDDMAGGTGRINNDGPQGTEGRLDGNDTMEGGTGFDVISGDNAIIVRTLVGGKWTPNTFNGGLQHERIILLDVDSTDTAMVSGDDHMWGDDNDDVMYGQGGDDEMHGGAGQDYMEGNAASDTMSGDPGQDDMIGGTGLIGTDPDTGVDGRHDGNDTMYGESDNAEGTAEGDGADVMLGDNGIITRPLDGAGNWTINKFNGAFTRIVTILDVETTVNAPLPAEVSGGDDMWGNDNDDVMYGQGGVDEMHGGAGADYMEGNAASDVMYGDAGQDDMIGGTGPTTSNKLATAVDGRLDAGDTMYGESDTSEGTAEGDGADVMLGDNGIITRPLDDDGAWIVNKFNGGFTRIVRLLDVETTLNAPLPALVSGGDHMWGNDNDDIMYGQGGEDVMYGGAGDDYMEGNAASDIMSGDTGQDDMIGGTGPTTSNDPSSAIPGRTDMSTQQRKVPFGPKDSVDVNVPLGDTMYGGDGADVMLGDNGIIARPLDNAGQWKTLNYLLFADTDGSLAPRHPTGATGSRVDRQVSMIDTAPGKVAGSDLMYGGAGEDDLYGQFDDTAGATQPAIGDEMYGDGGEDAMVGDQGLITSWVIKTATQYIRPNQPFLDDNIFIAGTLFRQVELKQMNIGGKDRMCGGDNSDWMHGGAGDDLMNGNSGNDRLFGHDGNDVIWGGPNHDHLWGGYGNDYLDVKPRPAMTVKEKGKSVDRPADPKEWFVFGAQDNFQDVDYVYGGWDQDAMQANVADTGPRVGDRLMDWVGAYNVYFLCPGLYGEYVATRAQAPGLLDFLQQLAQGDGAFNTATKGSSGFREVGIVFKSEEKYNANPIHPDNVGHFTCP